MSWGNAGSETGHRCAILTQLESRTTVEVHRKTGAPGDELLIYFEDPPDHRPLYCMRNACHLLAAGERFSEDLWNRDIVVEVSQNNWRPEKSLSTAAIPYVSMR